MTEEEVEPADTDHETEKQRPWTRWGIVTSVLLHVPVVALLIFGLPKIQAQPAEEESVKVELVPPPEEEKAEEPKPEEKQAEKPPEVPKPEEKAEAPPPPPPPPPPAEQEKPPKQTPPEQKPPPEEQSAKADDRQGRPQSMPVLRPVFEFGEKDAGPEKSLTGDSSVAGEKPPAEAKTEPEQPKPAETAAAENPPASEEPPAPSVQQDIEVPEVSVDETHAEGSGPPAEAPDEAKTSLEQAKPPEEPKVPEPPKPQQMAKLTEAKTLFSRNATNDPAATTAMGNLSRGDRVALLCSTELNEQLRHALPDYNLEALPRRRLQRGTMLQVKDAFRADGRWYNVSYRCEIDADAMKVVSFAFDVGDPIPRSEWRRRGLPDF
ncbi:DUF930 domain-containing protein [Rhizobium binxianense]